MRALLALLFLSSWLPAWAGQDIIPLPDPLDLQTCIALAEQHPQLAIQQARTLARQAERDITASELKPQVHASAALRQSEPMMVDGGFVEDNDANLFVRQQLWDFGKDQARLSAADARITAAQNRWLDAESQHKILVMKRFYAVLLADRETDVANEAMAVAWVRYRDAQEELELGEISEIDLVRLENRFRQTRSRYVTGQNQQQLARLALAASLGIEDFIPSRLEEPKLSFAAPEALHLDSLYHHTLVHNPLLLASKFERASRQTELEAAAREYWPEIHVEAAGNDYSRTYSNRHRWTAAIVVDWSLYEGGRKSAAQQQARALLLEARAQEQATRLQLKEALFATLQKLKNLQALQQEAETRLKLTTHELDYRRTLYELEVESDYGDALVNYTKADLFAAQVRFDLAIQSARLNALMGKPVEEVFHE